MARMNEPRRGDCPICLGPIKHWRSKQTPHGRYTITRCKECGHASVNPRPSLAFLSHYYASVGASNHPGAHGAAMGWVLAEEEKFPNSSVDAREMLSQIRAHNRCVKTPQTLLDIGCGYGFFSAEAQRHGYEVTAIELGPSREIAREMTGVEPHAVMFEEFGAPPRSFSAILMSQVLEHVHDANLWIDRAYDLLRPGGVLAIALPHFNSAIRLALGTRDPFITPPEHLNFFTADSLRLMLVKHGFQPGVTEFRSRIPPRALAKRLGRLGQPLLGVARQTADLLARGLDVAGLGIMVRTYGIRPL